MVAIRVSVSGIPELKAALERMNPSENKRIFRNGMIAAAVKIQEVSTLQKIKRGGKSPPLPRKLTSRTGTLRRSIKVDRGPLPFAIEVGTDLGYGAVHEFGGRVSFPTSRVKEHQRNTAFGRKVATFTVPAHMRRAYVANYPPRPFMKPALDAVAPKFGKIFVDEWRKAAGR